MSDICQMSSLSVIPKMASNTVKVNTKLQSKGKPNSYAIDFMPARKNLPKFLASCDIKMKKMQLLINDFKI